MNRYGKGVRGILIAALIACVTSVGVYAAQPGVMAEAAELHDGPYRDSDVVSRLAEGARVTMGERRGAWIEVATTNTKGWVRLYQVHAGDGTASAQRTSGWAMLWNIGQTGRSGAHGIDATTGIRGLDAADLQAAKPDEQAVKTLDGFRVSDEAARQYAASAKLHEHDVPFVKP